MNIFQTVTLIVIGSFGVFQLVALRKKPWIKVLFGLRWFFIFLAAFVVIAHPAFSAYLAKITGIKRGVDFIIYTSIIWLSIKGYYDSKKIDELEKRIDRLVSQQAIENYKHKDK